VSSDTAEQKQIETILKSLPTSAGVYRFLDKNGTVIYVGKAKNLKNRVQSYFKNDLSHSPKTRLLVKKIHDIKLVVVENETEALLLENNFIKQYKPRYNILLKDDKTYPWFCISNEEYPRIFTTRKRLKDGSLYFGPYPNGKLLKELQDLISKLYPYRRCNLPMTEANVLKNKYRSCLNKQIKLCSAPCEACVSKQEYREIINDIKKVLRGDFYQLKKDLKNICKVIDNGYEDFVQFTLENGKTVVMTHGTNDSVESANNNFSKLLHTDVYRVYMGHLHDVKESRGTLVNGSIMGGDDYSISKRLNSKPTQLLEIYYKGTDDYSTYRFVL
jgi:excinuclease ABC subunit C